MDPEHWVEPTMHVYETVGICLILHKWAKLAVSVIAMQHLHNMLGQY